MALCNLPINPVVIGRASESHLVARPLTSRPAIRKLQASAELRLALADTKRATVMHVQCKQDAVRVADELAAGIPMDDLTACEMRLFAGVPAGAGTAGVAWSVGAGAD